MYRLRNFYRTCNKMQGRKRNSSEMTAEVLNTEHAKRTRLDLSERDSGDTGAASANGPSEHNTTQLRRIHRRHDDPPKHSVVEWIGQHAGTMLCSFIFQRASFDDIEKRPTLQDLGGESEESDDTINRIVDKLLAAAQKLDADEVLQQEINKIDLRISHKSFMTIVKKVFSRGMSWGCAATLFYFAYKLIMRVFTSALTDFMPTLMMWVQEAILFYIVPWISQQGGWTFLLNYIFGETEMDHGPKTLPKRILSFMKLL
uniref:uncharacterized protein n=1 Tax=Myxine glutinosa TaxID=7769 RepID=UPI00358DD9D6